MLTYTYVSEGTFALMEKPKPVLQHERDAIVKVTLASICSSDLLVDAKFVAGGTNIHYLEEWLAQRKR